MRTDLDLQEESSIPVVKRVVTEDELRTRRLAAFQRDNFIQKKNEYVEKILEKGRLIEEKLNQGGNFEVNETDLIFVIMEENSSYWRKSGAKEKTSVSDLGSYAARATSGVEKMPISPQQQMREDYRNTPSKTDPKRINVDNVRVYSSGEGDEC